MNIPDFAFFNILNEDRPWNADYRAEFMWRYREFAAYMLRPIKEGIENSELRKSIKVVKPEKWEGDPYRKRYVFPVFELGTKFLRSIGDEDYTIVGPETSVSAFSLMSGVDDTLEKISEDRMNKLIRKVTQGIVGFEIEAVNKLKEYVDTDNITMYIKEDWVNYEDPYVIKRKRLGIYGWEHIALVAE